MTTTKTSAVLRKQATDCGCNSHQRLGIVTDTVGRIVRAAGQDVESLLEAIVSGAMSVAGASGASIEIRDCAGLPGAYAAGSARVQNPREGSRACKRDTRAAGAASPKTPRAARACQTVSLPLFAADCGSATLALMRDGSEPFDSESRADIERVAQIAGAVLLRAIRSKQREKAAIERSHDSCAAASEVRFGAALAAAHEAMVIRDRAGAVTAANASASRILGFSAEELFACGPAASEWTLVHEDRSEFAMDDLPDMLAMRTARPVSDEIVGIERSDGAVTWLSVSACPLMVEGDAEPYGAIMTFTDISARKAAFEANARLAAIVDSSQDGILGATLDGTIVSWNRGAERLFGYHADEILGRASSVLSPSNDPVSFKRIIKRLMLGERIDVDECVRFRKDGVPLTVAMTYSLIHNARGEAVGIAAIARDVSERVRYEEQIRSQMRQINEINAALQSQKKELERANVKLEELATLDGLTGLKNRRVFQDALAHEIETASRYNTALSIFMLDVDSFKGYNDSFGHPAGDQVLRKIARLLAANCRRADLVSRYGGEEFVVILPQTPAEGARIIAERCRSKIERCVWPLRPVTASIGVSTLNAVLDSPAAIVAAADRALYHAKSRGKNCVSHVFDMPTAVDEPLPSA